MAILILIPIFVLNLGSLEIFVRFGFSRIHYVSCVADGRIEWPWGVAPPLVPLAQHELPFCGGTSPTPRSISFSPRCFFVAVVSGQINQEFFTNLLSSCWHFRRLYRLVDGVDGQKAPFVARFPCKIHKACLGMLCYVRVRVYNG